MKATILVHRVPTEVPVRTSFGVMHDRPSVVLRLENEDGALGFGEIWCNFPAVGAEHRARLLETVILPLVATSGLTQDPAKLWSLLTQRLHVLAIQSGEPGPIAQCIAGLECALQDLAARRAGLSLSRFLNVAARSHVSVYASGINPDGAPETAADAIASGYAGCKIKIGFDVERDRSNLREARTLLGADVPLMADANQAFEIEEALDFAPVADELDLFWLEEPLPHDASDADWIRLHQSMRTQLAAGENFTRDEHFDVLADRRSIAVLQPDLGRWGGVARLLEVARKAEAAGRLFCPHWLGGGVGLLTSCHVKAASGIDTGFVEVDFNRNPMRSEISAAVFDTLHDGRVQLSDKPGIGIDDEDINAFARYLVWSRELRV